MLRYRNTQFETGLKRTARLFRIYFSNLNRCWVRKITILHISFGGIVDNLMSDILLNKTPWRSMNVYVYL